MSRPFWCWDVQIMCSWWVCWFTLFGYEYCSYFSWCKVLYVPVIVHHFVKVLFRIVSRELAVVPTAIMELFPDPGVIGINCL